MKTVPVDRIEIFFSSILKSIGLSKEHASYLTNGLLFASMRGVDTHGIRLFPLYYEQFLSRGIDLNSNIEVTTIFPSVIEIDAKNGSGIVVGVEAAIQVSRLAKKFGISAALVKNSNHFGAASFFANSIANNNQLGIVMSNTDAVVSAYNGINPVLGTNPIAIAAQGENIDFFSLDMTTSQISWSLFQKFLNMEHEMPKKSVKDRNGHFTTDPKEAYTIGPLGGYKGQGLSMAIEIICAALTGGKFSYELDGILNPSNSAKNNVSQFFLAIEIYSPNFKKRISEYLQAIRDSNSMKNTKIFVPGEKESEIYKIRKKSGIPIDSETLIKLQSIGRNHNVFLAIS